MKKIILFLLFVNTCFCQTSIPETFKSQLPPGIWPFDFHQNDVYFSTITGNIFRFNSVNSISTVENIASNLVTPFSLSIYNNYLYYTEFLANTASRINLSNSNFTSELLPIQFGDNYVWKVYGYDDKLYFSDPIQNIKYVPINAFSSNQTLVSTGILAQQDFLFDNNLLYSVSYIEGEMGGVYVKDLNTSPQTTPQLIAAIYEPSSLAKINNLLFVGTEDKIYRINLNQSNPNPEIIYEINDDLSYIGLIKSHNNDLYFSLNEGNPETEEFEGKIMKFTQNQLSTNDYTITNTIQLFPNPASNLLTLDTNFEIENIEFYDVLGKKIDLISTDKTFDVSNLSNGVYHVKIQLENGQSHTLKFIKN